MNFILVDSRKKAQIKIKNKKLGLISRFKQKNTFCNHKTKKTKIIVLKYKKIKLNSYIEKITKRIKFCLLNKNNFKANIRSVKLNSFCSVWICM